ncbi:hypothetical protein DB347_12035 [Opitutaceae bacterium EW11]|nr:hypothetical protein DB347_12035 [Opitutaceae bacterium EW11]
MNTSALRIEKLPAMRVASVQATSTTPERDAWAKLEAWAAPLGLLNDLDRHPVFGFNNPRPRPNHPDHGYEFWIRVDPETAAAPGIALKDFPGGLFAVTRCRLVGDPAGEIDHVWLDLWKSVQTGPYRWRQAQELEKPVDPRAPESELCLDLYLPVTAV